MLRVVRGDVQRLAARLRMGARQVLALQVDHAGDHLRARIGGTVWLYVVIPKGFFPTRRHRLHARRSPRARPTSRSAPWSSGSARSPRSSRKDPAVDYVNSTVGAGGPNPTANQRPHVRRAEAEERARQPCGPCIAAAAPRDRRASPACRSSSSRSRTSTSAAASPRASIQYTLQSSDTDDALHGSRRRCATKIAKIAGPARRQHRPLHQESADDGRGRPREGRGLRHHRRSGPAGAVQRLRLAPGRDDLHADQRLPGHPGDACRNSRPIRASSRRSTSRPAAPTPTARRVGGGVIGTACRPGSRSRSRGDAARADGRAAAGQPSGPAAVGDDLVQPRAGRLARRTRSTRSSSIERDAEPAGDRSRPASRAPRRCSRNR